MPDATVMILLNILRIDLITPGAWQRPPAKRLVAILFDLSWRKTGMLATIIYGNIQKLLFHFNKNKKAVLSSKIPCMNEQAALYTAGISAIVLDMPGYLHAFQNEPGRFFKV
jgi:hypothetical protein